MPRDRPSPSSQHQLNPSGTGTGQGAAQHLPPPLRLPRGQGSSELHRRRRLVRSLGAGWGRFRAVPPGAPWRDSVPAAKVSNSFGNTNDDNQNSARRGARNWAAGGRRLNADEHERRQQIAERRTGGTLDVYRLRCCRSPSEIKLKLFQTVDGWMGLPRTRRTNAASTQTPGQTGRHNARLPAAHAGLSGARLCASMFDE